MASQDWAVHLRRGEPGCAGLCQGGLVALRLASRVGLWFGSAVAESHGELRRGRFSFVVS